MCFNKYEMGRFKVINSQKILFLRQNLFYNNTFFSTSVQIKYQLQYLLSLFMGILDSRPEVLKQEVSSLKGKVTSLQGNVMQLKQQLMLVEDEARRLKNPKIYKKLKEYAWNSFFENLAYCDFQDTIEKKTGEKYHMLIGNISAGKTSLINFACNTKLKVGMGETTTQACRVCTNSKTNVNVYDSPGSNEDFTFYDLDTLKLFWSMDRIFIVYCDSLKSCPELVKAMYKVKPSATYLVRSMCDRGEADQARTIRQELQVDKKIITEWGVNVPILATSSRKGKEYLDNKKFCELLTDEK